VALGLLSPLTSAANIGRSELGARDNVGNCKAILIALKASAFCSSFVPITDITVTASCTSERTKLKRQAETTRPTTTTSTTTKPTTTKPTTTKSTTTKPISTTAPTTTKVSTTTSAAQCSIKGVNSQLANFGCSVIKEACTLYVTPKTLEVRVQTPGSDEHRFLTVLSNARFRVPLD
jgi:cell division septation protein DedD